LPEIPGSKQVCNSSASIIQECLGR